MAAGTYTDPNGPTNTIGLRTEMITSRMDDIIVKEAKTTAMTADPSFVQATSVANEFKVATISTTGLGNYDKTKGYPRGQATLEWNTYSLKHDRGVVLDIDRLDQAQSGGLATTGALAAFLTRNKINPEIDATRISGVYAAINADTTLKTTNLKSYTPDKATILSEIEAGLDKIAEVWNTDSGYTIYLNSNIRSVLRSSSEVTKVRHIDSAGTSLTTDTTDIDGNAVVWVPSDRMKTAYTYYDGVTDGQTDGGIVAASGAQDINFLIVAPGVASGVVSVQAEKYITKEVNQIKDADALYVRIYHDVIVPKNAAVGAYVSVAPAGGAREPEPGEQGTAQAMAAKVAVKRK